MIGFRFFLVFLLQLFVLQTSKAQYALRDVPAAFKALSAEPQVFYLNKNHIKAPSGGHLQGIQALSDSVFVITGSSSSYSYYITADKAQLTSIHKISDRPFRHAGGCQIYGSHLAVGIEDNKAKDRSKIADILLDDNGNELSRGMAVERKGAFKRSTAGAVGEIFTDTNYSWVMAVADWDSRNIDFYYSVGDSIAITDSAATMVTPINYKWCAYQSINLIMDTAGRIYLIGFGLDGANNRADLFSLKLKDHQAMLNFISTRNFNCKKTSFRYAAGLNVTKNEKLVIYSSARNVGIHTPVNVFK